MTLPTWLRDRLGTPSRGRGCKAVKCISCRADVLAGFDEDLAATAVVVDPYPLNAVGEALALLDGRRSYELGVYDQGQALWVRSHWNISGRHPGIDCIVLTDHRCGGQKFPMIDMPKVPKKAKDEPEGSPPF